MNLHALLALFVFIFAAFAAGQYLIFAPLVAEREARRAEALACWQDVMTGQRRNPADCPEL